MLPGRTYTPEQIVRIARQRWWMLVLPLVVGIAGGSFAYRYLPVKYRSETLILVVPQRIPDTYVKSTVSANVEDRLRSVSEQILSRSRLQRIMQDFDLYPTPAGPGRWRTCSSHDERHRRQAAANETSFRVATPARTGRRPESHRAPGRSLHRRERARSRKSRRQHQQVPGLAAAGSKQQLVAQEEARGYRRRYAGQLRRSWRATCSRFRTPRCSCSRSTRP